MDLEEPAKIKLIITDIDGVWTDGGMYYSEDGVEIKKFNTSDSMGLVLARAANLEVMVVTGENVQCVQNRMTKLKVTHYHPGVKDKLSLVEKLVAEKGMELSEVAFIGDELNDHPLLRQVGFSGCPQSAPWYTVNIVDYVVPTDGGKGAFRDFVIEILRRRGELDVLLNKLSVGILKA